MTKKDYELIANALNNVTRHDNGETVNFEAVIAELSNAFRRDNHNFKNGKFYEACMNGKHVRKSISCRNMREFDNL